MLKVKQSPWVKTGLDLVEFGVSYGHLGVMGALVKILPRYPR